MQRGNYDSVAGEFVPPRQDHVDFGGAGGLEGRVVVALGFFDVVVEEGEFVGEVGGELGGVGDVVVDEFLEETVLHAGVGD